jgi:hypothetical protein
MRKSISFLASLFLILFCLNAFANSTQAPVKKEEVKKEEAAKPQETAPATTETTASTEITVDDAQMATAVEQLNPTGAGTEFPKETPKLYCWSKIKGAEGETSVKHVWYRNNSLISEISLPVKAKSWRTYSYKSISPEMTGEWKVDITTADGKVLKTLNFSVK